MIISVCIPCHNRTHNLKRTLPRILGSAASSPPVEIVVLDYNSPDDLSEYMAQTDSPDEVSIVHRKFLGRDYYHMAHARNLSVLSASGEYVVISCADAWFEPGFFESVRETLKKHPYKFLEGTRYTGIFVCQRQEFIDAGGFDERFEFYGPEDRDISHRLHLRCGESGPLNSRLVHVIHTPDSVKEMNYRLLISKEEMSARMRPIFDENVSSGVLIANPNGWGQWTI